jgi:hypothetical protein
MGGGERNLVPSRRRNVGEETAENTGIQPIAGHDGNKGGNEHNQCRRQQCRQQNHKNGPIWRIGSLNEMEILIFFLKKNNKTGRWNVIYN